MVRGFPDSPPYAVVVVELEEGSRVVSGLRMRPKDAREGPRAFKEKRNPDSWKKLLAAMQSLTKSKSLTRS